MKVIAAIDPGYGALVRLMRAARDAYYNTGEYYVAKPGELPPGELRDVLRPTKGRITDAVYDKFEDMLRAKYPNHALLKKVGAPVTNKKTKIKLPFNMPSLDKIKGADNVSAWLESHDGPYIVSDKVDGVSIGIRYDGTTNTLGFTRGDGATGGDISFMLNDLGVPSVKKAMKIRGEVVMPLAKFNALWSEHFANPRNMVGGITNRNSLHEALAHCHVYFYEMIEPRMRPSAALAKLESLGFRVVPHKVFQSLTYEKLEAILEKRLVSAKYEMDGLVVTQDKVNPVAKSNPDFSVAFKSDAKNDSAVVEVVDVEWRPTRTGQLFPRVIIKPVKLKGVTVTYCSGKSAARIRDLGIGPGAKIRIARSGDVIPDIRDVVKAVKPKMPNVKDVGKWEWSGDNLKLVDHDSHEGTADSVAVQRMSFFLTTLGVERLKGATLQKFADAGTRDVTDLLNMPRKKFLSVPGTSEKVLTAVWDQLQDAINGVELHVLMYASGLFGRNFGSRRLAAILKELPDVLSWKGTQSDLVAAIDAIEGFDDVTATQFAKNLPVFRKWLRSVPQVQWVKPKRTRKVGNSCAGQAVVMTGFRDAALQKEIESQGGVVIDSIKKATVLLAKDPSGSSSKLDTARQLKVPIMTVEQFRRKFLGS